MNKIVTDDILLILSRDIQFRKLEGKTILFAGANSFIASYMMEVILHYNDTSRHPCRVVGIVRNSEKAKKRFADYSDRNDFKIIQGDVCVDTDLGEPVNYIVHAASQASPKYYSIDPVGTFLPNVIGTYNLLEIARKNDVEKFLFFSSSEVYGNPVKENVGISESDYGYLDIVNIRSCYAEGKRAGETLCISYAHQFGVNVNIVRPFHTYGPHMPLDDGRVYADFVSDIINGKDILLSSDGSAVRAFCYIMDAVDGFFRVLFSETKGEAYNIGSDIDVMSIKDLAETVASLSDNRNIKIKFNDNPYRKNYIKSPVSVSIPDISKAKELGFRPGVRVKEGFSRTIQSYF